MTKHLNQTRTQATSLVKPLVDLFYGVQDVVQDQDHITGAFRTTGDTQIALFGFNYLIK